MTWDTALLVFLLALTSSVLGQGSSFTKKEEQEAYLKRYAYMGPSSPDPRLASITDPEKVFQMAVIKFQMMTGINQTGVVDEETVKMMEMPRCGLPDEDGMSMVAKRRRRRRYAAHGSRWPRTALTYRINNFTPDLRREIIDSEIQAAFKRWSDVTPLTFTKVTSASQKVDIDIRFVSRDHGDGSSFDGAGGVLAHAFYPQYGGATHFDEDELWTSNTYEGTNLLFVAIHEFGHALGLAHSDVQGSIMAPVYRGYVPNVQLHTDDIAGMMHIYGSMMPTRRPTQTARPPPTLPFSVASSTTRMPPSAQVICRDPKVNAIFAVNEDVYIFKGAEYYMGRRLMFLSPPKPLSDWPGLPDNIDTAVYVDGSIVFFKGQQCWRYNNAREPDRSNPQSIASVFTGLPNQIDAAFVWSGNGKLYFISGDKYYRMSKKSGFRYQLDFAFPQPLRIWKGLPSKIDAAFNYTNSRTYFISGTNFYRFNDVSFKVDSGYPQPTATYWLGCSDRIDSETKSAADDMMEKEWMAGGDQFMSAGVGLPTYSVLLPTIASLALLLLST